jgi:hypothetical protein
VTAVERGVVARELAAEFPGLALHWIAVEACSGRSPHTVRERLRDMSNRISGPKAIQMRQEAVPWAYRVFFRQVGIDPDERRTPAEQIVLDRLQHGGFKSRNLLDDAITIATFEARPLSSGQIVIADAERPLAVLFGDLDPDCGVTPKTERMVLAAVQVEGVPGIAIEECLWTVEETLTGA